MVVNHRLKKEIGKVMTMKTKSVTEIETAKPPYVLIAASTILATVTVLCAAIILIFAFLVPSLNVIENSVPVINVSGRQRMLSQVFFYYYLFYFNLRFPFLGDLHLENIILMCALCNM